MPKPDYRIPSRRERELFNQVRDLRERLDALSKDLSAELDQVINMLLKLSRLPQKAPKTFEGFDF